MFRFFEKALVPTVVPDGVEPPPDLAAFYWHFARQAKPLFIGLFAIGFVVQTVKFVEDFLVLIKGDSWPFVVNLDHHTVIGTPSGDGHRALGR